jgi:EF hand
MRANLHRSLVILAIAALIAMGITARTIGAAQQQPQKQPITPASPAVAAGEAEAKKLLVLMDTDHSGRVSKEEFLRYMAAEFDRLDINHDGQLDITELEQMQATHHGGTRR